MCTENKGATKRATVYFDSDLHQALSAKAEEAGTTISQLVNEAVQLSLAEDAEDLAAFAERADEPTIAFEDLVADLKARGKT